MVKRTITQAAYIAGFTAISLMAFAHQTHAEKPSRPSTASGAAVKKGNAKSRRAKKKNVTARPATPVSQPTKVAESAKPRPAQTKFAQARASTPAAPASEPAKVPSPVEVAARVDAIIHAEMQRTGTDAAQRTNDADFLRRVSFDIAGISPAPQDVTLFGLDPDPEKRQKVVERLLASPEYATNWARYWRDVIFLRATETRARLAQRPFESWMTEQLASNKSWNEIASALLTATGDVSEVGQTALIFAQRAEPDEVAAETSRIFLGIQLQCANCHDHPTDSWKRDQFHGLAAFFPRISMRPKRESMKRTFEIVSLNVSETGSGRGRFDLMTLQENPERFISLLDKNGDRRVSRDEVQRGPNKGRYLNRLIELGDSDKDGELSALEIKKLPPPMMKGRGSPEYYMPDLNDPQSRGTKFDPQFFLGDFRPGAGLSDHDRREALARYITAPENPWFARALVNRIWAQLVGTGFYMPVDDIGPERSASHPEALLALSDAFTASGYDLKWLLRAIAATETYQRQIRWQDPKAQVPAFASAGLVRLKADQLYDSLVRVLKIDEAGQGRRQPPGAPNRRGDNSPRGQFIQLFTYDPSTPPDEVTGTLPQALFLMNSPVVNNPIRAKGETALAALLGRFKNDGDALKELYLLVHAREPSEKELTICREHIAAVGNRAEAYEDILWSLLNSTEFQTKH